MAEGGTEAGPGELIVTTGGQQAIDLLCRVMLDPGDPILAEGPTYPGAVPSFSACGAEVHQVPMDGDGHPARPAGRGARAAAGGGPAAEVPLRHPDVPEPGRRHALARAPPRAGGVRAGARPAARGGRPVRPAALRGRAAADAALARRDGPRHLPRHAVQDLLAGRARRLDPRAAPDPLPRQPRQAGQRPVHVDVRAAARAGLPAARAPPRGRRSG